jgi:intein/homing endonuclease
MMPFNSEMLQWSVREQSRYIRGFVDGEGWPAYYRTRSQRGHHRPGYVSIRAVFISNTNKALLENIRVMLLTLGIESKLYLDARAGVRRSKTTSWKIAILGRSNLLRFQKRIGFSDSEKMNTLRLMLNSYKRTVGSSNSV